VTGNKVAAGFAEAGIFLVPPQCIGASTGANSADGDDAYCPPAHANYGGDAVIDITDDWLKKGSDKPEFDVWTGPQFRFQGTRAEPSAPPPCNRYFKISIANNPDFVNAGAKLSRDTEWLVADTKCQGHWMLDGDADWISFWKDISETSERAYYRVLTGNKNTQGEVVPQSSSEYPGKPFYTTLDVAMVPPFAVLNATGEPE
jgi:hypothetical protein